MKELISNSLNKAINYNSYREVVKSLLAQGKSTGHTQSESLLHYSKLNDTRMNRLDKTTKINEDLVQAVSELPKKYTLLTISEGWCGDAAHVLPVLNKVSETSKNLDLKIVSRDENDDLMNQFLTNGSKSIPKVIVLDEANEVVSTWGPRPSTATEMVNNYKEVHGQLDAEFKKDLQLWYNKDKGQTIQNDLKKLFLAS
jgi:thioredoxin-like negative regulator of GroEL